MFRAFDNRPVSCRAAKCCLTLKTEMRYALHLQRIHIYGRHSKFSRCSREWAWLLARNYRCVPGSIEHAACRIQKLFPDRRMTARRIRRTRSDALVLLPLILDKWQESGMPGFRFGAGSFLRESGRSGSAALGRVSRASPVHTAVRNCTRDEGGPFGFGDQVLIPSYRELLRSKAVVVSVAETPGR